MYKTNYYLNELILKLNQNISKYIVVYLDNNAYR
jgi:hypothetical protein